MAAYATVVDVQSRIPDSLCKLGPGSQPTLAQVEDWLEEQSRWVDASLRWKYAVPITDAADLAILKPIIANLTTAMVWDVIAGHDSNYAESGSRLEKRARQALAYQPATGRSLLVLPSSTLAEDGEAVVGQPASTFTDPGLSSNPPRLFTRETRF